MSDGTLEHYRLSLQAQSLAEKIDRRSREAIGLKGFSREKAWLADAHALLSERIEAMAAPLQAAQRLPELEGERDTFARGPQHAWVDALERLWAGISFHLGRRAPLLEALFPHQKFAALRKPKPEVVRAFQADLERRTKSSYVQRMLADGDAQFALPVLAEVTARFSAWAETLAAPALEGDEAEAAREAVRTTARRLEPAMKQAKHLLEAANLALPEPEPDLSSAPDDADDEAEALN
jgi:hypothetical protein